MIRTCLVGCGAVVLVACGGSSLASGTALSTDAGASDAAQMTEDDAPSGRDAGATGSDGPSPDSGAMADDRIDPIEVGRTWTYDVQELGTYPLCPSGTHSGSALGTSMVGGKEAIEVQSACAKVGSAYYAVTGDLVQLYAQGTWVIALDTPVQEGHSWSDGATTFTWHSVGSVTVPAGTFDACWSATQNVAYSAYAIFCRGVGPVRWYTKDASGNGYDAQLTATSL